MWTVYPISYPHWKLVYILCGHRLTQEFITDPLEIRFSSVKISMLREAPRSFAMEGQEIKLQFIGECGGGNAREIRWTVSGDVRDFYAPGSTYIEVLPSDDDGDYCIVSKLDNGTGGAAMAQEMSGVEAAVRQTAEEPVVQLPVWRFEYYLIGGAGTICILIIINNYKEQQFDRILALLTKSLQTDG